MNFPEPSGSSPPENPPGIKIIWLWNLAGGQGEEKYIKELGISGFTVPFFKEYMKPENQPLFRKLSEEAGLWAEKGKS